jgi:SOS-response transcriptional repressor LexA
MIKSPPKPIDYVAIPLQKGERIEDIAAYITKGNCMAPDVVEGDRLIVNRSPAPQDGDIVVAYWRGMVAYYRMNRDSQPYLQNGHGIYEIPTNAVCAVVTGISRKLKEVRNQKGYEKRNQKAR